MSLRALRLLALSATPVAVWMTVIGLAVALLAAALFDNERRIGSGSRRCSSTLPFFLGALLTTAIWVAVAHPPGHRLYFDEDAYANVALNVSRGWGPRLTTAHVGTRASLEEVKWPVAYPVLAAPFVSVLGTERGPRALNAACGLLTLAMVFWLGVSVSPIAGALAVFLFGLNPLVGGWYRAGSADPLALFFMLVAAKCVHTVASGPPEITVSTRASCAAALFATTLALYTRLETALFGLAFGFAFGRPLWLHRPPAASLLPGLPLFACYVVHVAALPRWYVAGRPESSFSLNYLCGNVSSNVRFLVETRPLSWLVLAPLTYLGWLQLGRLSDSGRRLALALVIWQVSAALLLSGYSAGRLELAGGTRFLLGTVAVASLLTGIALATVPRRFKPVLLAAATAAYVLSALWPGRLLEQPAALLHAASGTHSHVLRTAPVLTRTIVVVSPRAFLWDNHGVAAVTPNLQAQYYGLPGHTTVMHDLSGSDGFEKKLPTGGAGGDVVGGAGGRGGGSRRAAILPARWR